jgi:hypothetical protein
MALKKYIQSVQLISVCKKCSPKNRKPFTRTKSLWFKGTVSRDFLIRFMTLKTKSVLFVQALIV